MVQECVLQVLSVSAIVGLALVLAVILAGNRGSVPPSKDYEDL